MELGGQAFCVLGALTCADPSGLGVALVQTVVVVPGEEVDVKVPDVLATGRLVVLTDRGPSQV